jgi:hypothetical protein
VNRFSVKQGALPRQQHWHHALPRWAVGENEAPVLGRGKPILRDAVATPENVRHASTQNERCFPNTEMQGFPLESSKPLESRNDNLLLMPSIHASWLLVEFRTLSTK